MSRVMQRHLEWHLGVRVGAMGRWRENHHEKAGRRSRLASARPLYFCEALEPRTLLSLVVPAYHSLPNATAKLYLDFVGSPAFAWGGTTAHGPGSISTPIPAFTIDSDGNNFSATELGIIQQIWSVAAEKLSPFNIDVTTQDPGNRTHGLTLVDVIGGSNSDWYGPGGGVAQIGSFTNPNLVDAVFAWPVGLDWSAGSVPFDTLYLGTDIAHEAGHAFGLDHQRSAGTSNEYYNGDATRSPIMGNAGNVTGNNPSVRGIWWLTNMESGQQSTNPVQDDMAVISNSTNGFGYRPDDYTQANYGHLTIDPNGGISPIGGVIENTADQDPFYFRSTGTTARFTINNVLGGMLAPTAFLTDGTHHSVVATVTTTGSSATITTNSLVPGDDYFLVVASQGGYGNVGQYTVAGSLQTFAFLVGNTAFTPGTLFVVGLGDAANDITVSRYQGAYRLTDTVLGSVSTQFFDATQVALIQVALGNGNDTLEVGGYDALGGGDLSGMVPVVVNMGGGNNTLKVDDSDNTSYNAYDLFPGQIGRSGSSQGTAIFDNSVGNVKFFPGGGFHDPINVYGTSVPTAIQGGDEPIINIGAPNPVGNAGLAPAVGAVADSGGLILRNRFDPDPDPVGVHAGVDSILGALTITNPQTHSTLKIDDSGNTVGKSVLLTDHSLTGLCAPINWAAGDINGVTVSFGSGGNFITVTGTDPVFSGAVNQLNAGPNHDYVDVESIQNPLTVYAQGNGDTVSIAASGRNLDAIQGALTLVGSNASTLILHDELNPALLLTQYIFTTNGLVTTTLTRLAQGINPQNGLPVLTSMAIAGNSFGNFVLDTGATHNVVNVAGDASPVAINAGIGNLLVAISQNEENLDLITYPVTVNGSGSNPLVIEDQNNPNSNTGIDVTTAGLVRRSTTGIISRTATINFSGVGSVTYDGGAHTNTFYVEGTPAGSPLTLNGGGGPTFVNVTATTAPVTINQSGPDVVTLGSLQGEPGNLQNIHADVTLGTLSNQTSLILDDSADTTNQTVTVTDSTIAGLAPAVVHYLGSGFPWAAVGSLIVKTGAGNDTVNVVSTGNIAGLKLASGAGNDTVTLAAGNDQITNLLGPKSFDGGDGTDVLVVNDQADTSSQSWVADANLLSLLLGGLSLQIPYSNFESVVLNTSNSGGATVAVNGTTPGSPLTVNGAGATINVNATGSNAPVVIPPGPGNDTLNVNTGNVGSAAVVLAGTQTLAALTIGSGGVATLMPGMHVLTVSSLAISTAGRLDLTDGGLIVDYTGASPLASIRSLLASGYSGNSWSGAGIDSSAAAASQGRGAVGFAEASSLLKLTGGQMGDFMGRMVDATSVLVRYTLAGDTNLDAKVDFTDLLALAQHYGSAMPRWDAGDFHYNGMIGFPDLLLLAQNYGRSNAAVMPAAAQSSPPSLASNDGLGRLNSTTRKLLAGRRRA